MVPPLALGRYHLRLVALRDGHIIATTGSKRFEVFGVVPLARLLNTQPESIALTSTSFSYVATAFMAGDGPRPFFSVEASRNPCRSVHIKWGNEPGSFEGTVTVSVLRASADPVSSSAAPGATNDINARLVPGESWSVTAMNHTGYQTSAYLNGSASCWSTSLTTSG